jgi:hypothetical protein
VFNRRPKKAFEKIRTIYGERMMKEKGFFDHTSFGNLTSAEKEKVRLHVQNIITKERKRQMYGYIGLGITCFLAIILTIVFMK